MDSVHICCTLKCVCVSTLTQLNNMAYVKFGCALSNTPGLAYKCGYTKQLVATNKQYTVSLTAVMFEKCWFYYE